MPGLEGTSLGRYRLKRRLGRGGMAEVYLATDERMQRDVAVKVVNSSQADFARRFSREAQAMGNLHHDHLLAAYDVGTQEPWYYLVMPYIEHGTLSDLLKKRQEPLDPAYAGEILQQIAEGLQYAHDHGLIHRDIKPSNILLRDDHYVYLADFGLARSIEGGGDLTQTGTLLGTPEYMAPELAEGPASKSSDIYALAVVLYQMITGQPPFRGDTPISVFWKQMRDPPQPPSHLNPRLSWAIDRVLIRALDKDPARRYPTPLALSQAYQQALTSHEAVPEPAATEANNPAAVSSSSRSIAQDLPPLPPLIPSQPAQQEKLFLPGENAAPVRSVPPDGGEARRYEQAPAAYSPPPPTTPPRRYRRGGGGGRVIAGVIMGIVFLLAVSGILAYLTIQTRQQNAASTTATAQANATGTVIANQTQQVVSTHTAQTAVAATATAQAIANLQHIQATATAITAGKPLLDDPLTSQDANTWPDDGTNCVFANNVYTATATGTNRLQPCIASVPQYGNAAYQVNVKLTSAANAGLLFRADATQNQFYDFEITGQGEFYFRYFKNGTPTFLIAKTASSAIRGPGNQNTLLAIARNNDFQLFINGTFVGEVHDSTFTSGQVGVAAGTLTASSGSASFTSLRVYSVG